MFPSCEGIWVILVTPYLRAWDNMNCAAATPLLWQPYHQRAAHSTARMDSRGERKVPTVFLLLYDETRQYKSENSKHIGIYTEFKWKWVRDLKFVIQAALTHSVPGTRLPDAV